MFHVRLPGDERALQSVSTLFDTLFEVRILNIANCPNTHSLYHWVDEKGKRTKVAAPQYIDYVMIYTQKTVNDESIFPTKFGTHTMR